MGDGVWGGMNSSIVGVGASGGWGGRVKALQSGHLHVSLAARSPRPSPHVPPPPPSRHGLICNALGHFHIMRLSGAAGRMWLIIQTLY